MEKVISRKNVTTKALPWEELVLVKESSSLTVVNREGSPRRKQKRCSAILSPILEATSSSMIIITSQPLLCLLVSCNQGSNFSHLPPTTTLQKLGRMEDEIDIQFSPLCSQNQHHHTHGPRFKGKNRFPENPKILPLVRGLMRDREREVERERERKGRGKGRRKACFLSPKYNIRTDLCQEQKLVSQT